MKPITLDGRGLNRAQLAEEEVHILRGVARAVQQMAAKAKR